MFGYVRRLCSAGTTTIEEGTPLFRNVTGIADYSPTTTNTSVTFLSCDGRIENDPAINSRPSLASPPDHVSIDMSSLSCTPSFGQVLRSAVCCCSAVGTPDEHSSLRGFEYVWVNYVKNFPGTVIQELRNICQNIFTKYPSMAYLFGPGNFIGSVLNTTYPVMLFIGAIPCTEEYDRLYFILAFGLSLVASGAGSAGVFQKYVNMIRQFANTPQTRVPPSGFTWYQIVLQVLQSVLSYAVIIMQMQGVESNLIPNGLSCAEGVLEKSWQAILIGLGLTAVTSVGQQMVSYGPDSPEHRLLAPSIVGDKITGILYALGCFTTQLVSYVRVIAQTGLDGILLTKILGGFFAQGIMRGMVSVRIDQDKRDRHLTDLYLAQIFAENNEKIRGFLTASEFIEYYEKLMTTNNLPIKIEKVQNVLANVSIESFPDCATFRAQHLPLVDGFLDKVIGPLAAIMPAAGDWPKFSFMLTATSLNAWFNQASLEAMLSAILLPLIGGSQWTIFIVAVFCNILLQLAYLAGGLATLFPPR